MQRIKVIDSLYVEVQKIINDIAELGPNIEEGSQGLLASLFQKIGTQGETIEEKITILTDVMKSLCALEVGEYKLGTINLMVEILSVLIDNSMQSEDWEQEIAKYEDYYVYENSVCADYGSVYYQNGNDDGNGILMLVCTDIEQVRTFLEKEKNMLQELLLLTLKHIDLKKQYDVLLLAPKELDGEAQKRRIEFAKLNAVLNGKVFKNVPKYSRTMPAVAVTFDNDIQYEQFSEIVDVMNEYNLQEYTLEKFLRIYQVIENFMFKNLICVFCKDRSYQKLTVRDFKDISVEMGKSEEAAMQSFLDAAGKIAINSITLEDALYSNWISLIENDLQNKIMMNKAIQILGVKTKNKELVSIDNPSKQSVLNVFGKLIYRFRCSIVHNKVNEYHITYVNFDENLKWVLEKYLIPDMETLVYDLMLNRNDTVAFIQKSIALY